MVFNPLRKVCIAIENHHFEEVKQRTKWGIFQLAMVHCRRVWVQCDNPIVSCFSNTVLDNPLLQLVEWGMVYYCCYSLAP